MNITTSEVIFTFIIILEITILITYDHRYFEEYIDVAILILLAIAGFMIYNYFSITKKMPVRINKIVNPDDFNLQV